MSIIPTRTNESDSFNRLWATAMSRLPGIGTDALKLEMSNAMQEFLRNTHCWREKVVLNLIEGQSIYDVNPQANCADVAYVIRLRVDDRLYQPLGAEAFDGTRTSGTFRVLDNFREVELHPAPTASKPKALQAWVGLSLKPGSLDMPDALLDHYFENILDGVLDRGYAHPTKPYSNAEKQVYHHRRFLAAITRTRREIRGGKSQATPPWLFNQQAPGRPKRGARSYGW